MAPRRTEKSKPRLTRENDIILPHFFHPLLFSYITSFFDYLGNFDLSKSYAYLFLTHYTLIKIYN